MHNHARNNAKIVRRRYGSNEFEPLFIDQAIIL